MSAALDVDTTPLDQLIEDGMLTDLDLRELLATDADMMQADVAMLDSKSERKAARSPPRPRARSDKLDAAEPTSTTINSKPAFNMEAFRVILEDPSMLNSNKQFIWQQIADAYQEMTGVTFTIRQLQTRLRSISTYVKSLKSPRSKVVRNIEQKDSLLVPINATDDDYKFPEIELTEDYNSRGLLDESFESSAPQIVTSFKKRPLDQLSDEMNDFLQVPDLEPVDTVASIATGLGQVPSKRSRTYHRFDKAMSEWIMQHVQQEYLSQQKSVDWDLVTVCFKAQFTTVGDIIPNQIRMKYYHLRSAKVVECVAEAVYD